MTNIKGIGASSGIAIAKAYKLEMPDLTVSRDTVEDTTAEIKKLYDHKAAVEEEIKTIKEAASKNLSAEEAAVFDAHLMMLNDPEFAGQIESKIKDEKLNAAAALEDVANMMIAMFSSMDDAYFKERAADVKDVSTRWKAHLLGKKLPNPSLISEEVVICANDLTPSDTATLNKNLVKGFVTNIGGRTSHYNENNGRTRWNLPWKSVCKNGRSVYEKAWGKRWKRSRKNKQNRRYNHKRIKSYLAETKTKKGVKLWAK